MFIKAVENSVQVEELMSLGIKEREKSISKHIINCLWETFIDHNYLSEQILKGVIDSCKNLKNRLLESFFILFPSVKLISKH